MGKLIDTDGLKAVMGKVNEDINTKADAEHVHDEYLTQHQDLSEYAKKTEVIAQPNFTYAINMIASGQPASVTTTGTYPNLAITFNIPRGSESGGSGGTDTGTPRMWIGWIPFDQAAYEIEYRYDEATNTNIPTGIEAENQIGYDCESEVGSGMDMTVIQYGINNGSIIEMDPQTLNRYDVGLIEEAGYVCCVYPKSSNYVVTLDNGNNGKVPFDENSFQLPQNGLELSNQINNVTYCMTGGAVTARSRLYLYIDE